MTYILIKQNIKNSKLNLTKGLELFINVSFKEKRIEYVLELRDIVNCSTQ
jgi:hypothetical protein